MNVENKDTISHGKTSKSRTGAGLCETQQTKAAKTEPYALAMNLMEKICEPANLNQAYKHVKSNKGAPGIDGLTIEELKQYIRLHKEQLVQSLLDGSYKPQPVRRVAIPKAGGGERELGIPTVVDRLVQQAIHQVIGPLLDEGFSDSSYGFRPGRSAHDALKRAKTYVESGYTWVVDMDLEKFFDRVNHDILMSRLARKIGDKRLLKIIRGFLTAGIMQDGVVMNRSEGTPQGGPLSPLLSNVLLDELDKELERRGHRFCRYADDQNIYVRSQRAGERVFESIKKFLEKKLKLKVNEKKSAVAPVGERKFLGYRITNDGRLTIAPESLQRAKDKIRQLTGRNRGRRFEMIIAELNKYLVGWLNYYRLAGTASLWKKLDAWIRRKLRCYRLKQCKTSSGITKFLVNRGAPVMKARQTSCLVRRWWYLSQTELVRRVLDNAWFTSQGLSSLHKRWVGLLKA